MKNRVSLNSVVHTAACMLLGLALIAVPSAQATTYSWVAAGSGTWNTSTANWSDGVTNPTTWVNGSGNDAFFNAFGSSTTITLSSSVVANSLSTNGGAGVVIFNGGQTMDITTINTAGGGNVGPIDMFNVLTGNHDLNYFGGGTGSSGRLNLKAANTYTGDTNLSGLAYLFLGPSANVAYLPTTTTLNMGSTATTLRFGANNQSQEIAGLTSSGNSAVIMTTATGNTLIINTKSGVTTTYTAKIGNSLSLEIKGSGTQALNAGGTKDYTGSTTVSAGTLLLGTTLSNTSAVNVTGGTLRTSGANLTAASVANITMSSGAVDLNGVGAIGKLTIGGTKDLITMGGTIKFDLDTTSTLDQIVGSGAGSNFSLTNTTIDLNLITWTAPDYANTYALFTGFVDPGVVSNVTITGYDTANYTATLGTDGVLSFTAVPEPSTVALGAFGIALVAFRLRHRVA